MISLDEALARILKGITALPVAERPLADCLGHVLAKPLTAKLDNPPFDASAMDGYALNSADGKADASLHVIGESQAGNGFAGEVRPGQTVRIFTGAPLPKGADSVIMQEKVTREADAITLQDDVAPQQNVRVKGNDFSNGQTIAKQGAVLTPFHLTLAAAANNTTARVHARPSIALLATGDELVPAGNAVQPHQIVSSNSIGLGALLSPYAVSVTDHGIGPDNEAQLRRHLEAMLNSDADVIITTGSASVGDHDLVQPVLKSLGVEMDFWKIAIRPGKPLMFGRYGEKLVFGLPGNPVSALVTARVVVIPALRALAGHLQPVDLPLCLPLAAQLPANGPRRHFMRARLVTDTTGQTSVRPIAQTDSAHLTSLAEADCLIIQPENAPQMAANDLVSVIPLL